MGKTKLFTLEYMIRSSAVVLYNFLTTPAGLAQWFADTVDNDGPTYYFTWNGEVETAELISTDDDDFIRYRWDYQDKDEYFEFRIEKSEVTGDTILYISDFADDADKEGQKNLWDAQVKSLIQQLGAS